MKKYLTICFIAILIYFGADYLYYYNGSLYLPKTGEPECFTSADSDWLYLNGSTEPFEVRGVNLGLGKPGHFAIERAVTKEEYLRWFAQIADLGANTIRIYGIANPEFYEAFYQFNSQREAPLYLMHGVELSDYLVNSSYCAFDEPFYKPLLEECRDVVDVIHGRFKRQTDSRVTAAFYRWDISPWVCAVMIGTDWNNDLVIYTNDSMAQSKQYEGTYLYTEDARNFEIFLAAMADRTIAYETEKYGSQRAIGFVSSANTGPLQFSENVMQATQAYGCMDTNNIHSTDCFSGGLFAAYHVYPYYTEYAYLEYGPEAASNSYLTYLSMLTDHHTMPVVIAEFGVPSSRGMTSYEQNRSLGRDQGGLNEQQQGKALVSMFKDIETSGCAGGIVSSWQDEWYRRTWNTIPTVDLDYSAYWSDYQTNEQSFGLLSFDPGKGRSICYVDGDKRDWSDEDLVAEQNGCRLSMKYDLKFLYFLVEKQDLQLLTDRLLIPIDTTPKSGATEAINLGIAMSEPADFVLELNGLNDSRLWVQKRYDTTTALYGNQLRRFYNQFSNAPSPVINVFTEVLLPLREVDYYHYDGGAKRSSDAKIVEFKDYSFILPEWFYTLMQTYETGKLTYGNANPDSRDFNSLADFCAGEGFVEIKLPWQLLNFADPTTMRIHDDYYECYGVEYLTIDSIRVGVGDGSDTIQMARFPMKKLGREPQYHERLKQSYYILQDYWTQEES